MSSEKEQYLAIIAAALDFAGDGQKRLADQAAALVAAVAAVRVKVVQVEARMAELARSVRVSRIICSPADPVGALIADYNQQLDAVNAFWNGGDCDLEMLTVDRLPRNWSGSIESSVQSALRFMDGVVRAAADFPRQPRQLLDGYKNSLNEWKVLDKADRFREAEALLAAKTEEFHALCTRNPLPLSELAAFFVASDFLRLKKTAMASADEEQQHLCRIARQKAESLQQDTERQNRERREKELELEEERRRKLKDEEIQREEELRRNAEKRRLEDEERQRAEEHRRREEEHRRIEAESDSRSLRTDPITLTILRVFIGGLLLVAVLIASFGGGNVEKPESAPAPEMVAPAPPEMAAPVAPEMAAPVAPEAERSDADPQLMASGQWRNPKTGMIWMRCSLGQRWNGATCEGEAKSYTWDEAKQAVAKLNQGGGFGGYRDWVLPHIEDLHSLVSCPSGFNGITVDIPSKSGGVIHVWEGCDWTPVISTNAYWSSSPYAGNGDNAWIVNVDAGSTSHSHKNLNYYVYVVRPGQ